MTFQVENSSKRKGTKRKSNDLDTPLKETPRKEIAELKKKEEHNEITPLDFKGEYKLMKLSA